MYYLFYIYNYCYIYIMTKLNLECLGGDLGVGNLRLGEFGRET